MFTVKTKEELSNMSEEEVVKYYHDKLAHENKELSEKQESLEKELSASKETNAEVVGKLVDDINLLKDTTIKTLENALKAQGTELKKLIDNSKTSSAKKSLQVELKENLKAIKEVASGLKGNSEIVVKALTTRAAITNNESAFDLPDIGQLAHRRLTALDVFPTLTVGQGTHDGTIRYYDWDEATKVRAAAAVAEGAAFPESTAAWQKYTEELKKIGDTLPVTEEFFEDEQLFAAELGAFLATNVDIEVDRQIMVGDGTGANLNGLYTRTTAYTPVASAITDASIYDLIVKLNESITSTGGSKYRPDVAFMNIADINKMKLKKDANNNYVIPPFVSRDGENVSGVTIIENNAIAANTMVIGDRRYARVYQMAGTMLSRGFVGDQFKEDEMTLKVRRRLLFLVRNVDLTGWKKVTDISAALTTLAA